MDNDNSTTTDDVPSPQAVEFALLLGIDILAIICTILILIYVSFHWQLTVTKALHNHAILLIIIVSFFYMTLDLPFTISTYRLGYDQYRSTSFCLWWYWIDYTLVAISLFLTATASIQRYFILFKSHLLRSRRARWILHYTPLIICITYPPLFYLFVIFVYPCGGFNYNDSQTCLPPCYLLNFALMVIDWTLHIILPLVIIIIAHVVLLGWIIHSMWRLKRQQSVILKKQKKIFLQLFAFASLFVIGWAPSTIVSVLDAFSSNSISAAFPGLIYFYYIGYFICPLQPLICLFVLPEPIYFFKDKVKYILARAMATPVQAIQTAF